MDEANKRKRKFDGSAKKLLCFSSRISKSGEGSADETPFLRPRRFEMRGLRFGGGPCEKRARNFDAIGRNVPVFLLDDGANASAALEATRCDKFDVGFFDV